MNISEIAVSLEKLINNLNNDSDLNKLSQDLKNILLDLYTIINKKEKEEKAEKAEKLKIIHTNSENENSLEKEKSLENINNSKDIGVVILD